jgi:hypothetical protein
VCHGWDGSRRVPGIRIATDGKDAILVKRTTGGECCGRFER